MAARRGLASLLAAAVALATAACTHEAAPAPSAGEPQRVVSLAPSTTETLIALGLADRIVGVSDYCPALTTTPPPERVGGLNNLNLEAVMALHPDLVISVQNPGDRTLATLQAHGVPVFTSDPESLDAVFTSIEQLGDRFRRGEKARALTTALRARVAKVAAAYANEPKRPRVYVEVDQQGPWTVGRNSFVRDAVTASGAVNLFDDVASAYPMVAAESVAARDPDWILVLHPNEVPFESRGALAKLRAVHDGHVITDLDRDALLHSSPRLVDGIEALARRLHGQ